MKAGTSSDRLVLPSYVPADKHIAVPSELRIGKLDDLHDEEGMLLQTFLLQIFLDRHLVGSQRDNHLSFGMRSMHATYNGGVSGWTIWVQCPWKPQLWLLTYIQSRKLPRRNENPCQSPPRTVHIIWLHYLKRTVLWNREFQRWEKVPQE